MIVIGTCENILAELFGGLNESLHEQQGLAKSKQ